MSDRSGGRVKKIAWQYEGALTQRSSRLIYSLFEHLGSADWRQPTYARDRSSTAFDALLAKSLNAYFVVQHDLHANRWDDTVVGLLTAYLKFLAEIPQAQERPVVVVFLSVIFPRTSGALWRRLIPALDPAASRRRRIQRALGSLEASAKIPCRVLTELPSVTREDLLDWFSLNHSTNRGQTHQSRRSPVPERDESVQGHVGDRSLCAEELRNVARERGYAEGCEHVYRTAAVFRSGFDGFQALPATAIVRAPRATRCPELYVAERDSPTRSTSRWRWDNRCS